MSEGGGQVVLVDMAESSQLLGAPECNSPFRPQPPQPPQHQSVRMLRELSLHVLSGMNTHAAPPINQTNRCNHLNHHPHHRHAAEGILTARGGMTSHAAVVARGWGKPCICGCGALEVDDKAKVTGLRGGRGREREALCICW